MRDVIKIETERLILRGLRLTDAARVAQFTADPDVARMVTSVPQPQMPIAAEGFILIHLARAPLGRDFVFAIDLPGEGLIGLIGLHRKHGAGFELGYWIGKPYWGQGYASEAAAALLDAAQDLGPIVAGHYADNPASGRVLEKIGFAYTGEVEDRFSLARGKRARAWRMRLGPVQAETRANASTGADQDLLQPCCG